MKFLADIDIMPLPELLDPQGKSVKEALHSMGLDSIAEVRIGKHIQLEIEVANENIASETIEKACVKLLMNPITENYRYVIRLIE